MKFELTLDKMNKNNGNYSYTFTSGHKLKMTEFVYATGRKNYICSFSTPKYNGCSGSFGGSTAQECLDLFKEMLENNEIRARLIKGFIF